MGWRPLLSSLSPLATAPSPGTDELSFGHREVHLLLSLGLDGCCGGSENVSSLEGIVCKRPRKCVNDCVSSELSHAYPAFYGILFQVIVS